MMLALGSTDDEIAASRELRVCRGRCVRARSRTGFVFTSCWIVARFRWVASTFEESESSALPWTTLAVARYLFWASDERPNASAVISTTNSRTSGHDRRRALR